MIFPKLLVYCWNVTNEKGFLQTLDEMKIPYIKYGRTIEDYHADGVVAREVIDLIIKEKVEAVFSFDYFPLFSMLCEIRKIPYISWVQDCPLYTLYSATITNSVNYIFCFDKLYAERVRASGAKNCIHFPLGGRAGLKEKVEKSLAGYPELRDEYSCDISFLGNLYNDKKNRLQNVELSSYSAGYVEGLVRAQAEITGYNLIKDVLDDRVVGEIVQKCKLSLGELYLQNNLEMAADAVNMVVTAREREQMLELLSDNHVVHFYTASEIPLGLQKENIVQKGYADYDMQMPYIFHKSRINLNHTSRTIESGIPLRVLDVLSCGGFCLTNYQPEIAEYFEEGRELVIYYNLEDMLQKADYYLTHEEERTLIARQGYEKLKKEFSLEQRIIQMLKSVFEE